VKPMEVRDYEPPEVEETTSEQTVVTAAGVTGPPDSPDPT
jgi:hypothetical protein